MPSSYEDYAYDQYMSDLRREEELQGAIEDIADEHGIDFEGIRLTDDVADGKGWRAFRS